jgi:tetrahydromethanopterin S-methyltransferase subunit G
MIGIVWTFLTGNKIARTIGMVVMAVLGVLTFGAVKKREGAQDAKAKQAVKDAKAYRKTNERMQDADAAMGDDPAVLRDSLRKRDPNVR